MTLGERLEEARKRKGLSIREVAEATKIRGDYIVAMEDNSMSIPLPEIYVRGFLRNYARYLRLDAEQAVTDYEAMHRRDDELASFGGGGSPAAEGPVREKLGRIELKDDAADEVSAMSHRPSSLRLPRLKAPALGSAFRAWRGSPYLKVGLGLAVGLVAVLLIVWLVLALTRTDAPALNPELAPASVVATPAGSTDAATATTGSLQLRATGDLTLIVNQVSNGMRLYSGSLNAGQVTPAIPFEGRVEIRYNNAAALEILIDGRILRPNQQTSGSGRIFVP